ncbi:MAG: cytidylate kinase-like family protein [Dehalococcoidia bacterium]|nr:cytidylate kinase-like family protein [Dehalococcoidia bacterium]
METRVITIARQVGTGGEDVAGIVAAATGYRLLDYRVVQEAAQEAGVSPETVSDALHKPSFFARIIEALARNPATPASGQWGEPINIAATPCSPPWIIASSSSRSSMTSPTRAGWSFSAMVPSSF